MGLVASGGCWEAEAELCPPTLEPRVDTTAPAHADGRLSAQHDGRMVINEGSGKVLEAFRQSTYTRRDNHRARSDVSKPSGSTTGQRLLATSDPPSCWVFDDATHAQQTMYDAMTTPFAKQSPPFHVLLHAYAAHCENLGVGATGFHTHPAGQGDLPCGVHLTEIDDAPGGQLRRVLPVAPEEEPAIRLRDESTRSAARRTLDGEG